MSDLPIPYLRFEEAGLGRAVPSDASNYPIPAFQHVESWKANIVQYWNRKEWDNVILAIRDAKRQAASTGINAPQESYSPTTGPRILTHIEGVARSLNGEYSTANQLFNDACKPEPQPFSDPLAVASLSWMGDACLASGDRVNALAAWSAAVRVLNKINPKGSTTPIPPDMNKGQKFLRQMLWHLRARLRSLYPYEVLVLERNPPHLSQRARALDVISKAKELSSSPNIPVQLLVSQVQDPWSIEISHEIFDWPCPIGGYSILNQDQFLASPDAALLYISQPDLDLRQAGNLLRPKESLMNALNSLAQGSGKDSMGRWGIRLLNPKDHAGPVNKNSDPIPYLLLCRSSCRGIESLACMTLYILEGDSGDLAGYGHVDQNTMCADLYVSKNLKMNRLPEQYFKFQHQYEVDELPAGFIKRVFDYLVEVGVGGGAVSSNGRPRPTRPAQ